MPSQTKHIIAIALAIAILLISLVFAMPAGAKEIKKVDLKDLTPITVSKNIDEDCYHKKSNMLGCLVEFKDETGKITSRKKYIAESLSPFESRRVPPHEDWHEVESILEISEDEVRKTFHLSDEWVEPREYSANMYAYWRMGSQLVEDWYGDYFRGKIR